MPTVQDQIRAQTEAFAADISALVRRAALEAVQAALDVGPAIPARAPAKKAPATKAAPARKAAAAPPAKAARGARKPAKPARAVKTTARKAAPKRPLGAKRPPAELAALVDKLAAYISKDPGQGVEVIGKGMNTPTKELTLPIKKLLSAKRIRSEGAKRATKYFPA